ncbi:MAG TPA: aldo/keto reductase [Candidatus Dormibacteraeota bacterium]|jgi:aryl-alcohol dehydrogenase-like predicted oxidoreductase|nr:aldo/keto reductase [Candidatus Dormibacteraeota bacterium]
MKYVEAGGVRVSAIGLGTWQFGSTEWGYGAEYNRVEAGNIVRRALELGVNMIDTAEFYGFGRSERILGEAIRGRRDSVFLATKIFPIGLPFMTPWRARRSARRLGVDRIDLYQLHWPSPLFPPRATMPRMRRLVEQGLVAHVGVSNHNLAQWKEAERALGGPILSNQVRFSLVDRRPERELVPWAEKEGRIVIAYSPLGQGLLSGKYQDAPPSNLVRRRRGTFSAANRARLAPLIAALREIGERHSATPAQVSLAWLIRKPNVVAIPGASSVHQLEENVGAGDIVLSDEESARLDGLSA